jgi:hypothetical protein
MKAETSTKTIEMFSTLYRMTVYHDSGIMQVEKQVELGRWKAFFKQTGYEWKTIYFGQVSPLQEFANFYYKVIKNEK